MLIEEAKTLKLSICFQISRVLKTKNFSILVRGCVLGKKCMLKKVSQNLNWES